MLDCVVQLIISFLYYFNKFIKNHVHLLVGTSISNKDIHDLDPQLSLYKKNLNKFPCKKIVIFSYFIDKIKIKLYICVFTN